MERWSLARCRTAEGAKYYLANRSRTYVDISSRAKSFNPLLLLEKLEEVGFPLRFTEGLTEIHFTYLKPRLFGEYEDDEIWVDVKKRHRMKTLVETFVHEVAHHVDISKVHFVSADLIRERKRRGQRIHRIAQKFDDEYFARGFEKFYSLNPRDRKNLRRWHPRLYSAILRLHKKHASRR